MLWIASLDIYHKCKCKILQQTSESNSNGHVQSPILKPHTTVLIERLPKFHIIGNPKERNKGFNALILSPKLTPKSLTYDEF